MAVDNFTADDVAAWMLAELNRVRELYQEEAVWKIQRQFGKRFVYENTNGNLAIGRDVLKAFRKLTGADVIWDKSERMWRKRQNFDTPGRQQS